MTVKVVYFNDTKRVKKFHSGTEERFTKGMSELNPLEVIELEVKSGSELFIKEWDNDVILFKEIKGEC